MNTVLCTTLPLFLSLAFGISSLPRITRKIGANCVLRCIAGNEYNSAPAHHHQAPAASGLPEIGSPSSTSPKYVAQNFYPTYAQQPNVGGPAPMPSVHGGMDPMHPSASTLAAPAARQEERESHKRKLFGDLPETKRRKFILVEDAERNNRARVRVTLEDVNMEDMPDSNLKINSVYPRSYYPRQVGSPSASPRTRGIFDDEDDTAGESGATTRGKTLVRVPLLDGSDAEMAIPRMTKSRRNKELMLNELGARMSWAQSRVFHQRILFLQKSRRCTSCWPVERR
jgi:hypothetical protein